MHIYIYMIILEVSFGLVVFYDVESQNDAERDSGFVSVPLLFRNFSDPVP